MAEPTSNNTLKTLAQLNEPFKNQIKVRQDAGTRNEKWDYIPHAAITRRLNDVLGFNWSIAVEPIPEFSTEKDLTVKVTLIVTLGNGEIRRAQFGESAINTGISKGNAAKIATSDGLKKAASLFGVGLEVWENEEKSHYNRQNNQPQTSTQNNQQQTNGNDAARPTQKPMTENQHKLLCKLVGDNRLPDDKKATLTKYLDTHEAGEKILTTSTASDLISKTNGYIAATKPQQQPATQQSEQPPLSSREEEPHYAATDELPF